MVEDWRAKFRNKDMPFYYMQIAPWKYPADKGGEGRTFAFCEMQYALSKIIPNSGIAVTADVGSDQSIHPPDKTTIAERLLNIALAKTHGYKE